MSYYNECHNEYYCTHGDRWQLIKDYDRQRRYIGSDDIRPDWCPLYPFPEPKDVFTYNCTGKTGLDLIIECAHDEGYNECLRELKGISL